MKKWILASIVIVGVTAGVIFFSIDKNESINRAPVTASSSESPSTATHEPPGAGSSRPIVPAAGNTEVEVPRHTANGEIGGSSQQASRGSAGSSSRPVEKAAPETGVLAGIAAGTSGGIVTKSAKSVLGSAGPQSRRPAMVTAARPATADPMEAIDSILAQLPVANLAFNTPDKMQLHDTAMIELVLGLEKSVEQLSEMITAAGRKEGASLKVSSRMEARLSGTNFQIVAITPEVQLVSHSSVTKWKWDITPLSEGAHSLHLTLSALFSINGENGSKAIRTFDKTIAIEVTLRDRIMQFLYDNWQWLWAAILVPLAGWFWRRRHQTKQMPA